MATDINKVVLVGRLTRDSELKYTSSGTAINKFSIAVNRNRKQGDQWIDEVNYFDITLWGKRGEALQPYLLKGKQVAVEGELRQNRWEQDGQKRSKVEIFAVNIQLLGGRSAGGAESTANFQNTETGQNGSSSAHEEFEDDIPF